MNIKKINNLPAYALITFSAVGLIAAIAGKFATSSALVAIGVCCCWIMMPDGPFADDSRAGRVGNAIVGVILRQAFVLSVCLVLLGLAYGLS